MNLIKELERLHDEKFVYPKDGGAFIPCDELSDEQALCKRPLVSVHMMAYNHEKYIRQAIESVMAQKTSFEYELVVGEDCSSDHTIEICRELQKRYPRRIRILWWKENVSRFGGNSQRILNKCRGKYIAFLEGDDYWLDENKLQKQVSLIEATDSVASVAYTRWDYPDGSIKYGCSPSAKFLTETDVVKYYYHTSTYVFNREVFLQAKKIYSQIPLWYDTVMMHAMVKMGRICVLPEIVSVYRITGKGIASSNTERKYCLLRLDQRIPVYSVIADNDKILKLLRADIISTIRQIFAFGDFESYRWVQTKKWILLRIYVRALFCMHLFDVSSVFNLATFRMVVRLLILFVHIRWLYSLVGRTDNGALKSAY